MPCIARGGPGINSALASTLRRRPQDLQSELGGHGGNLVKIVLTQASLGHHPEAPLQTCGGDHGYDPSGIRPDVPEGVDLITRQQRHPARTDVEHLLTAPRRPARPARTPRPGASSW